MARLEIRLRHPAANPAARTHLRESLDRLRATGCEVWEGNAAIVIEGPAELLAARLVALGIADEEPAPEEPAPEEPAPEEPANGQSSGQSTHGRNTVAPPTKRQEIPMDNVCSTLSAASTPAEQKAALASARAFLSSDNPTKHVGQIRVIDAATSPEQITDAVRTTLAYCRSQKPQS